MTWRNFRAKEAAQAPDMKPLTPERCRKIAAQLSDDLELWDRFWAYMLVQIRKGAPVEYVKKSYDAMESVWESRKQKER